MGPPRSAPLDKVLSRRPSLTLPFRAKSRAGLQYLVSLPQRFRSPHVRVDCRFAALVDTSDGLVNNRPDVFAASYVTHVAKSPSRLSNHGFRPDPQSTQCHSGRWNLAALSTRFDCDRDRHGLFHLSTVRVLHSRWFYSIALLVVRVDVHGRKLCAKGGCFCRRGSAGTRLGYSRHVTKRRCCRER
jgi:hypothetical protein